MDDFGILGIAETRDPRLVKAAFRARAKELHPDLAGNDEEALAGHYRFSADSPWAADARDKMAIIESRSSRYRRILESFGAWRRAGKERGRQVAGIVDRTRKLQEEEGELRWPPGPGSDSR